MLEPLSRHQVPWRLPLRLSLLSVIALCVSSLAAHADTFTNFNLISTFNSPGNTGTINGTLTYDNTTNQFTAVNAFTAGFPTGASNGQTLDQVALTSLNPLTGNLAVLFGNATGAAVRLVLPTPDLSQSVISICTVSSMCGSGPTTYQNGQAFEYQAISGTLTTVSTPVSVTPEPSSIALLGTGLLGVAGVLRKRLA